MSGVLRTSSCSGRNTCADDGGHRAISCGDHSTFVGGGTHHNSLRVSVLPLVVEQRRSRRAFPTAWNSMKRNDEHIQQQRV